MNWTYIIPTTLLAYVLGSIPTAVWYSKNVFGFDIRQKGSGNAGAANTFRVMGRKAGVVVLLIDVLKGWLAAMLAICLLQEGHINAEQVPVFKLILGFIAILGHLYPVFAQFRGGKGVATALGLVIALQPQIAGICMVVFLVTLLTTKFTSLSSMVASLAFPIMMITGIFGFQNNWVIAFGFGLFALVVYTHRSNISRIRNGTENKTHLFKTKKAV